MKRFVLMMLLAICSRSVAQTDCTDAMVVCGNTNFEGLHLDGIGSFQEISSCGSEEHNSLWLKIHIATSGTLAFNIIPDNTSLNEDYDFFLFSYTSCDDYTQIRCSTTHPISAGLSTNVTGTNGTETDSFEGPAEDGDGFVRPVDVFAGETYMLVIDRPFGNSDFSLEWTGTATFNDPPAFAALPTGVPSLDIMQCDDDGMPDGSTVFDLTQNTPLVLGGQPDLSVHYYRSQSDSLLGINEIANPDSFVNTSDPQTIYVRLVNDVTECFSNSDFQIGIDGQVSLAESQYAICDDASDGDAFNGQATFNMFDVTQIVFPDSVGYSVQYFLDRQDAENNVNPLAGNFYNTVPDQQTVYIKADNGSCKLILPVDLLVRFIPPILSAQLTQCDFGPYPDGISTFNLSTADALFTGSDPDLSVAYFRDAAAMAGNVALPSVYINETDPQTVLVKITDALTGCSATNTLTLNVNTVTPQQIMPLQSCDVNGNGFAVFDLTHANVVTSPQESTAFYRSLQDALLEQNGIGNVTAYTNALAYDDSVFVRIDDAAIGCSGIIEIALHVNPLPEISISDQAILCVNQPGSVTTIDAGPLPPGVFTFVWHFNNSVLPDATYSIAATQTGTYGVDIINAEGCQNTRTIRVLPADVPAIQSVSTEGYSATVNISPGFAGNYGFSIDQPDGPFQAGNFFADVACGAHIAYVYGGNGCGTTSFAFEIMGIPAYFSPNGDGFADRWNMRCGEDHPNTTIYIFDRFGKLIKQINAAGQGWDGTYNGHPLPADDYWYILNADDGTTSKGHFTLKR